MFNTIDEAREYLKANHEIYGEDRAQFIYTKNGKYNVTNSDECEYAESKGWTFVE